MKWYAFPAAAFLLALSTSVFAQDSCQADACLGVAKSVSPNSRELTYSIVLENFGSEALQSLSVDDDLDAVFGAGNYVLLGGVSRVSGPVSLTVNAGFDGTTDTQLLGAGASLVSGATATLEFAVEITTPSDQGLGLGVYSNQVVATGQTTGAVATQDTSDNGSDPDPNGNYDPTDPGESDPTINSLLSTPRLGVSKAAFVSGSNVEIEITVVTLGNESLENLSLIDDLDSVFGAGNYSVASAPSFIDDPGTVTLNAGFDGSTQPDLLTAGTLALGDEMTLTFSVDITNPADVGFGLGNYRNQAEAFGETALGQVTSDLSTEGFEPDPNGNGIATEGGENVPTIIVIGEEPAIGAAQEIAVSGDEVTADLYFENLGNVNLSDLSAINDLNEVFGAGNYILISSPTLIDNPGTVTLNPAFDGNFDTELFDSSSSTLASADTLQIQFIVEVLTLADRGAGFGVYSSQVFVEAIAPGGGLAFDASDNGTNPDPNGNGNANEPGENDSTPVTVPVIEAIGVAKAFRSGGEAGGNPVVISRFTVTNYGNRVISDITIDDDLNAVYGAGNFSHWADPTRVRGATTFNFNAAFNGNTNTSLLTAGSTLAPGETVVFEIASLITNITDQGFGLGVYQNQVMLNGLSPDAAPVSDVSHEGNDPDPNGDGNPDEMDPTVIDLTAAEEIGIALDASVAGNVVTFDVYLENLGEVAVSQLDATLRLDSVFGTDNFLVSSAPNLVAGPGTLTLDSSYSGAASDIALLIPTASTLAPGATARVQLAVTVTSVTNNQGTGIGVYSTQANLSGMTSLGQLLTDFSDFGTDPDPDGDGVANVGAENDPTPVNLVVDSPIGVAKSAMVNGFEITIDLYLENLGSATVTNVSLIDDLDAAFGPGNYAILTPPSLIVDPGTLMLNGSFDGGADAELLDPAASTLNGGAVAQIQFVVDVISESDQGAGFGVYSNQARILATQPSAVVVSDLSDDGIDPDPNGNGDPSDAGEDDATPIVPQGNPAIGIAKKAYVNGTQVTLEFYIENLGDVTLAGVLLSDSLNPVFGSGNYSIQTQPTLVSGPGTLSLSPQFFGFNIFDLVVTGGFIRPGETSVVRTVINVTNVTDVGNGFGVYDNGVTVTATDPAGVMAMDDSDDGFDPDPNGNGNADEAGENDDTRIIIGDEARIGVAKDVSVSGQQVTFDYYLENFGTSTMGALSLTEDLDAVFGAGTYTISTGPTTVAGPATIIPNGAFDGSGSIDLLDAASTLAGAGSMTPPGPPTAQIRLVVNVDTVTDQGLGLGAYSNQVTFSGTAPLGTFAADRSNFGMEPDPTGNGLANDAGEDDPTTFSVGVERIGAAKNATVNGRQITFDYYLQNFSTSNTVQPAASVSEDLDAVFGAGNYRILNGPDFVTALRLLEPNAAFDGSSDTQLLAAGSDLSAGLAAEQLQLLVEVDRLIDGGSGLGNYSNQVTLQAGGLSDLSDAGVDPDPDGNGDPTQAGENDPTVFSLAQDPVVGVAKTVAVDGRAVQVDLYLESFANVTASNLSLIDDLDALFGAGNYSVSSPPTLIDDPGTLTLDTGFDGGGAPDLLVPGTSTLAIGDTAQIRFAVLVTTVTDQGLGLGLYDNQATLQASAPDGTTEGDLSDDGTDPDPDGDGDPTEAGEDDSSMIELQATIGDFVFDDQDGNAMAEVGEPAFPGITVYLDNNGNGMPDMGEPSQTTGAMGSYDFVVDAGSYTVRVDPGTVPSNYNLTTGNDPSMVTVFAGEDLNTVDFGFQQQDGTIGDFVWNDLDGDGVQDGGEPGIAGVTVFLDLNGNGTLDGGEPFDLSDGAGAYDITVLPTGSYDVTVDLATVPAGFELTGGASPTLVNLAAGEDFNDADFGFQQQDATIGDFVWNDLDGDGVQDGGEPGIAGVTVFFDLNGNGTLDGGEPFDMSDGAGAYDITALPTGSYDVTVDLATVPAGFELTGGASSTLVNLAAGEDFNDADFGFQQQDATIGDFVWNDLDGDGVQDAGEPGIAGVTIFLDLNMNGAPDSGEPSRTTDGTGTYDFTDLATGTYRVQIGLATVPTGFVPTGGISPLVVSLAAGEDFNDADFGFQQQDAVIGDLVWRDLDGDAIRDPGEPGIDGVRVFLDVNTNGTLDGGEPSTLTDSLGGYAIGGLPSGGYTVDIDATTLPAGLALTTANRPLVVTLAAGEVFGDADFGYQPTGRIGDFVFDDIDGDSIQDVGEPGLDGITVFADSNMNGVPDPGEPSDVTAGGGLYDLTALEGGSYVVTVDPATVPPAFVLTTGGNPLPVTIAPGEDFEDADFGFQRQDATIGDLVFDDVNLNGFRDGGEPGLAGVLVYADLNDNGIAELGEPSAISSAGGAYLISSLAIGTYRIRVDLSTLPVGYALTTGNLPLDVSIATAGETFDAADFGFGRQPEPGFAKAFADDPIAAIDTTRLVFTIDNTPSALPADDLAFSDTLPAGMTVAAAPALTNSCGGTVEATGGGSLIDLSGGTVSAGDQCMIGVDIAVTAPGSYLNLSGDLTSTLGNSGPATDSLVANGPPSFDKRFMPASIAEGGISRLELLIGNTDSTQAANSLDVTDSLPAGLTIAASPNASTTCTGGVLTAVSGAPTIAYTGGSVAAAADCIIAVDVTAASASAYVNTTGNLTSDLGDSGVASATLTVDPPPTFAKAFDQAAILVDDVTTLRFTIDNTAALLPAEDLAFTDPLPSGMTVATPANATATCIGGSLTASPGGGNIIYSGGSVAAGASCVISVDVLASSEGLYTNLSDELTSSLGNSGPAIDVLDVRAISVTLDKTFLDDNVLPGDTIGLRYSITNTSALFAASAVGFSDNLGAGLPGLERISTDLVDNCGPGSVGGTDPVVVSNVVLAAGEVCTIELTLQLPVSVAGGIYTIDSTPVIATLDGVSVTGNSASASFSVSSVAVTIPTLSHWALLVLVLSITGLAMVGLGRARA